MKSKLILRQLLLPSAILLSAFSAHAANITWADIGGNTNWTTGSSWVGGTAPANSAVTDTATFTSVANAQPNLNVGGATRSVNGIDFQLPAGGLNFTSNPGDTLRLGATGIDATTQLSGDSTVSVTNLDINGASHTWTLFSNVSNSSTSTFSVSSNIILTSPMTVRSDRNSAGGNVGIVNLSGAISGTNNVGLQGASATRNTINLTGNSSYTGTTTIQQVSVTANSLANAGNNSALGSSGDIILGTNTAVAYLTFQDLSVNGSTDRLLLLKGTTAANPYIIANNDADETIAFTNPGNTGDTVGAYTNDLIFALGGTNTGFNTFGQVINDRNGTNKTSLRKLDAGTWVLTNSNTYTGGTLVNGGLLRIDNTGALGTGNLTLQNGVLGLGAGDLTISVGPGDGQVQWTGSSGFAAFGGDRTVTTSTPGTSLGWTATNFVGAGNSLILGHASADSTLILDQTLNTSGGTRTIQVNDGSAAIDAKISRGINGGSAATTINVLNKSGAGTLALTANSFHYGDTLVSEGTLMIGAGGTTGGVSNHSPNIIVSSGATLAVNRSNILAQGTDNLIAPISGDGGFAQVGSGITLFTLANAYTGPTAVTAGTLTLSASGVLPDSSAVSIGTATLDTANGIAEDAGTLAVTGTATINLGTGTTLAFADSSLEDWTGGTLNITGDFVAGSSIRFGTTSGGLDASQLAVISVNGSGTGTYTLNASGYLVAASGSPYSIWATGDEPFDGDANGDGVQDGLAWILGAASPSASALNKLPVVSTPSGYLQLNFTRENPYSPAKIYVEYGTDLAGWTKLELPAASGTIGTDVIVTVDAGDPNPVTVKIPTTHASGGKLFARLSATEN